MIDWKSILAQLVAQLIAEHGDEIVAAIADFIVQLIEGLSLDDKAALITKVVSGLGKSVVA